MIRDVPPVKDEVRTPNCLAANPDPTACATPADALPEDPQVDAVRQADNPKVRLIDLTDRFCDQEWCYPVVGDVIVYRDTSHLTDEYSRALAPYIAEQVDKAESAGR